MSHGSWVFGTCLCVVAVFAVSVSCMSVDVDVVSGYTCKGTVETTLHGVAENHCFQLGNASSAFVQCDRYNPLNSFIRMFSDRRCATGNSTIAYLQTTRSCVSVAFGSLLVHGCNETYSCSTTYSSWSTWSTTCGHSSRVRVATSVYNDGINTTCHPPNLVTLDSRVIMCLEDFETALDDMCDTPTKTCWLYPDSPVQFSTFASFLVGSPVFTHGWTLKVHGYKSTCPYTNATCASVAYSQPPIISALHNISIIGSETEPRVKINVLGSGGSSVDLLGWSGMPVCGAFVLSGNNIKLSGFDISIDESCYTGVFPAHSMFKHGAAIRFSGFSANISNITVTNAVTAVLITSTAGTLTKSSAGRIFVSDLGVSDTHATNSLGSMVASCLGAVVVSIGGRISVQFDSATANVSCVTAFVPTTSLLNITTNGVLLDATAYILSVSDEVKATRNVDDNNAIQDTFYGYVLAVVLIIIIILFANILSRARKNKHKHMHDKGTAKKEE